MFQKVQSTLYVSKIQLHYGIKVTIKENHPTCLIGLTQWQHSAWQDNLLQRGSNTHVIHAYSRYFSSVEGNSTFYGLPKPDTVQQWFNETPERFRFCFKFPQAITHRDQLTRCDGEANAFFRTVEPLGDKLGLLCIQLPAAFSPDSLPVLKKFLKGLPEQFNYAVEIRHLDFFNKGDEEQQFNRLLAAHGINRISFDTRALFAHTADDPVTLKAKEHKPEVPVHALATGDYPMVRLITPMDWRWAVPYLTPWLDKAVSWIAAGKTPYFFFHTPDNAEAPDLAAYFVDALEARLPGVCQFDPWPAPQTNQSLF